MSISDSTTLLSVSVEDRFDARPEEIGVVLAFLVAEALSKASMALFLGGRFEVGALLAGDLGLLRTDESTWTCTLLDSVPLVMEIWVSANSKSFCTGVM